VKKPIINLNYLYNSLRPIEESFTKWSDSSIATLCRNDGEES